MRESAVVIGFLVGFFALLAASALWSGYVLTVLWVWFVMPAFGLPALALAPAIGLVLVIRLITYQGDAAHKQQGSDAERLIQSGIQAFLFPALALGFGWVAHQFM